MQRFTITIKPRTAFATPLLGDTLFGHCCWAIRHLHGEPRLVDLLQEYSEGRPFLVLSDALPSGFLPRPAMPLELLGFDVADPVKRKELKGMQWLPEKVLQQPLGRWAGEALSEPEMMAAMGLEGRFRVARSRSHNSLDRRTGTTGTAEGFAPYQRHLLWYHPGVSLAIEAELDESRLSAAELEELFEWIGASGFGKEASCGLGKFQLRSLEPRRLSAPAANALLTLAPCAPQGLAWQPRHCYYRIFTRFGRHGDVAVHQGSPFKNPVLMAASGAVLTPRDFDPTQGWVGQGLGGVSKTIAGTVQQGYAPVLVVQLDQQEAL